MCGKPRDEHAATIYVWRADKNQLYVLDIKLFLNPCPTDFDHF